MKSTEVFKLVKKDNPSDSDLELIYLDWLNDFLTTAYFAEHYEIAEDVALDLIERGRRVNISG